MNSLTLSWMDEVKELLRVANRLLRLAESKMIPPSSEEVDASAREEVELSASAQVRREAQYPSLFVDALHEFVDSDETYRAICRDKSNTRGESYEFALRLIAVLRRGPESLAACNKQISSFLDSELRYWAEYFDSNPVAAHLSLVQTFERFKVYLERTYSLLGVRAFSRRGLDIGSASLPLAEVILYELSCRDFAWLETYRAELNAAFDQLLQNERFQGMLGRSTSDAKYVHQRFGLWHDLVEQLPTQEVPTTEAPNGTAARSDQEIRSIFLEILTLLRNSAEYREQGCSVCGKPFSLEELDPDHCQLEMEFLEDGNVSVMHSPSQCSGRQWEFTNASI